MRVAFVHPDLGLGGAERLIVDAATGLQQRGHEVTIYTASFDANRCFEEVSARGRIPVRVVGRSIPRTLFGRLQALLTAVQCTYIAFAIGWCQRKNPVDVAVCDIVSAPNVVLALFRIPVVFYCHFPDKLLAVSLERSSSTAVKRSGPAGIAAPVNARSAVKRLYRFIVDTFEEQSMRAANVVLVNSEFTRNEFKAAFPSLRGTPTTTMLCISRFERKKRLELSIGCLERLRERLPEEHLRHVRLLLVGGYDKRLTENVEYEAHLRALVQSSGLQEHVEFHHNLSDERRRSLLLACTLVLYTPPLEHFGIVPLEAMASAKPVLACDSGGPRESVRHGVTGYLCEPHEEAFADAAEALLLHPERAREMGAAGRALAEQLFSRRHFAEMFECALRRARES